MSSSSGSESAAQAVVRSPGRKKKTEVQNAGADDDGWSREQWAAGYRSQHREFSYSIDADDESHVCGRIPDDIAGIYYRNGPGRFEVGGEFFAHPFDGDGYVLKVEIGHATSTSGGDDSGDDDRRVEVVSKYIRTSGYEEETRAQRILFRNTFGTQRSGGWLANALDLTQKNVANTGLVYWGSKLLALWEASQPYELQPKTLETIGVSDLGGLLKVGMPFATGIAAFDEAINAFGMAGDPLTAHPHVEIREGESDRLVTFGYQVAPDAQAMNLATTFTFYEFDTDFALVTAPIKEKLEGFAFVHDFCFTARYYIVFQNPVGIDMVPFIAGAKCPGECLQYDPSGNTIVHLIPRPGSGAKRMQFAVDACFVFHHANAYDDDDGSVVIDCVRLPEMVDFAEIGGAGVGATKTGDAGASQDRPAFLDVDFSRTPVNQLYRYRLDLARESASGGLVSPKVIEFPTVNGAYFGRKHRFVYAGAASHPVKNAPLQTWSKMDVASGELVASYAPGRHFFAGEPEFVARADSSAEDDGYLVGLFFNGKTEVTELHIVDALVMTEPIAIIKLKHHVPYGLHGTFVSTTTPSVTTM